jgi:hypothetical protein
MALGNVYYDPKHPAVFGSVAKLPKASKNKKRDVEDWLSSQKTYTLQKQVRKSFPRNADTVTNIDDVWEMDLADLSSLTKYNDKYKYLLNVIDIFQYLKRQGVNFHMTHNPDIKGAVIERFNKSLKTRMYKYFTKNNTYRYLDVINTLLTGYNNSVHSTIAMPPSKVNPSNLYSDWKRLNSLWAKIPQGDVKYKVGDIVRITKEKVKLAKGYEQTL